MLKFLATIAVLLTLTVPSLSQQSQPEQANPLAPQPSQPQVTIECFPSSVVASQLKDEGYTPIFTGTVQNGKVGIMIYGNDKSKRWMQFMIQNNKMCIIGGGSEMHVSIPDLGI